MTLARANLPTHALAVGATVAFALATLPAAHVFAPDAGLAVPMGMIIAAVAEIATCVILLVLYSREPRRSIAVLASAYLAVAAISAVYAASVPLGPGLPSLLPVASQVAATLFVLKWLVCAGCIVVYAGLRRGERETALPPRAVRWPVAALIGSSAVAAVTVGAILRWGERLPALVSGEELVLFDGGGFGNSSSPLAFVILCACVLAVLSIYGSRVRDGVDAGIAVTAATILIEVLLGFVDGRRFVVAWYVARMLCVPASMFVLVGSLHDLLRWRSRALDLAGQLAGERRRAERHSRRLETLWNLASRPAVDDDSFLRAVLDDAAAALQDGIDLTGAVSHLDGADIVVDVARSGGGAPGALPPGAHVPIEKTFLADVLRAGGTRSWSAPRAGLRARGMWFIEGRPWQGFIGTPVRVGSTQYFLSFVTSVPMNEPFSAEDHAYVETVAAFCAMRLRQREQAERLQRQSAHDPTTGLLNRFGFRRAATEMLASGAPTAIALIDVDRFSEVNETIGHRAADAMLSAIGTALTAHAGDGAVVARLGADVFAVMIRDAPDRAAVEPAVERLFGAFAAPFAVDDREHAGTLPISAAIGIALAPRDGDDVDRLLARAGSAVQTAKAGAGARYAFFDPRVEDAFARVRRMQNDLTRALVRGEFVLYFQPHVSIATGRVTGAEALIRWQHPERGLLPPAEFVPFAEEHGILSSISPWIVREAVRAARALRLDDPAFRVWFNLSAAELHDPELIERLRAMEEQFRGVGVEITETAAMRDVNATARNLAVLRQAGMKIALDDFGTGYSSLAQLKRLPIDVVKIDRSFTAGVPDDPHDAAIVEAVLGLARRYGFNTIAEGVETQRQASYLDQAGCAIAQGYLYSPPLPEEAFTAYMSAARNRLANAP
jgi:diguanylate cyclase (GGDEF)-like protein